MLNHHNNNNDIARNIADTLATIADNIHQGALAQHKTARLTEPETAHAEIEVMLAELAVVDNADLRSALYERIAQVAVEEILCIRSAADREALSAEHNKLVAEYGAESYAIDVATGKLSTATGDEKEALEALISESFARLNQMRAVIADLKTQLGEEV